MGFLRRTTWALADVDGMYEIVLVDVHRCVKNTEPRKHGRNFKDVSNELVLTWFQKVKIL